MITKALAWLSIAVFFGHLYLILWVAQGHRSPPDNVLPTVIHQTPDARSAAVVDAWTQNHRDVNFLADTDFSSLGE